MGLFSRFLWERPLHSSASMVRDAPQAALLTMRVQEFVVTQDLILRSPPKGGRLEGWPHKDRSTPYALQHLLDMGDRRFRLDAVAEIEDQASLREACEHVVDRAVERIAAGDQH
ncbi:hypothetical protein ACVWXO_010996 [Bradyrhizobium sp. LM2.7]